MKKLLLIVTALLITSGVNAEKLITIKEVNIGMDYDQLVSKMKEMNLEQFTLDYDDVVLFVASGENAFSRKSFRFFGPTTFNGQENEITGDISRITIGCGITKTCEMSIDEIAMALTKSKLLLFEDNNAQQCAEGISGDAICVDFFHLPRIHLETHNYKKEKSSPEF